MNRLMDWYAGLAAREQRAVGFGALALGLLILVGGILLPLRAAVSTAVRTKDTRREDLAWMRVNAPEVLAGGALAATDVNEPPVVVVDRIGREAGLGSALRGTQPSVSGVRVQLESAPFDTLLGWLDTLDQRYGLAVESITVDRAGLPGVVNANVTFTQAKH